jgi:hypothetical protein
MKVHQALDGLRDFDKLFFADMDLKKEGVLPLDFALQIKNGVIAKKQPTASAAALNLDTCTVAGTVVSKGSKATFTSGASSPSKKGKKGETFLTVVEDPEGRR